MSLLLGVFSDPISFLNPLGLSLLVLVQVMLGEEKVKAKRKEKKQIELAVVPHHRIELALLKNREKKSLSLLSLMVRI